MAEYINKSTVSGLVRLGWSGDAIVTAIINDGISSVPAIPIPEVKLEYHSQYDTGLLFDKKWWNVPYKGNLSGFPTGSESEDKE